MLHMTKTFRAYSLDQQLLLPPDMRSWLPEGDLALFVPMLEQAIRHVGQPPVHVTADAGYFSEANLTAPQFAAIECSGPPDRSPHARTVSAGRSRQGPFS